LDSWARQKIERRANPERRLTGQAGGRTHPSSFPCRSIASSADTALTWPTYFAGVPVRRETIHGRNRELGPQIVMERAEQRAPWLQNIENVVGRSELEEICAGGEE
jgi:hypothetical protein